MVQDINLVFTEPQTELVVDIVMNIVEVTFFCVSTQASVDI